MTSRTLIALALGCAWVLNAGQNEPTLAKQLEPLRPMIGKTWTGKFKDSTPEKPTTDVAKWERILIGQAVRITHSINDGIYGGETIIMWNAKTKRVEYDYFTTAGYTTHGTMVMEGQKIVTHEDVAGDADGITEVKAELELLPDGHMHVVAQYLKKGAWVGGHEVTYEATPKAEVRFK